MSLAIIKEASVDWRWTITFAQRVHGPGSPESSFSDSIFRPRLGLQFSSPIMGSFVSVAAMEEANDPTRSDLFQALNEKYG